MPQAQIVITRWYNITCLNMITPAHDPLQPQAAGGHDRAISGSGRRGGDRRGWSGAGGVLRAGSGWWGQPGCLLATAACLPVALTLMISDMNHPSGMLTANVVGCLGAHSTSLRGSGYSTCTSLLRRGWEHGLRGVFCF